MVRYFVILITVLGSTSLAVANPTIEITRLRCEYKINPLEVDDVKPALAWTNGSQARGEKQSAYQILVASSPELLNTDHGDLWESQKIASDHSSQILYGGKPLESRQPCFWKSARLESQR